MKRAYWIGAGLAVAFIAFGLSAFKSTLTTYVPFDRAVRAKGPVQVMGKLVAGSDRYDTGRHELLFSLQDDQGRLLPVAYSGIKPANFKDATSIVALGRYEAGRLRAHQLLVKCPSKYQGEEVERRYRGKS